MAAGESQFLLRLGPDRWPVLRGAISSKIDVMLLPIWFTKPSTVGAGSEKKCWWFNFLLKNFQIYVFDGSIMFCSLRRFRPDCVKLGENQTMVRNFMRGLNRGWGNQFWRWWCNDEIKQGELSWCACAISGWWVDQLCEGCGVEQSCQFVVMSVWCYAGKIEITAN